MGRRERTPTSATFLYEDILRSVSGVFYDTLESFLFDQLIFSCIVGQIMNPEVTRNLSYLYMNEDTDHRHPSEDFRANSWISNTST